MQKKFKLKDIYEIYRDYPGKKYHIPLTSFITIFIEIVYEHLLVVFKQRGIWLLPQMTGVLGVSKMDTLKMLTRKRVVPGLLDHVRTKEFGKPVHYLNAHTCNYNFGLRWSKRKNFRHFQNHMLYKITTMKLMKQLFHNHIMETTSDPFTPSIDAPLKLMP